MNGKDRERLMLSTGIALVGYAILFLLLMGLKWPPVAPFRSISPPASVYVSLQGPSLTSETATQAAAQIPPAPPKSPVTAPTPAEPKTPSTQSTVSESSTKPTATSSTGSSPAASSSAGPQPTTPAPVASQATAIPSRPNIPLSITNSSGPSTSGSSLSQSGTTGGAPQSGGPASGPASATPGVSYPPGSEPSAAPPQGRGGSGTQQNQGESQTYYGQTGASSGSIFNPDLAASAGSTQASNGAQGGTSSGGQAQGAASGAPAATGGAAGTGGAGGSGTGTGSAAASSSGPKIDWQSPSSARRVKHEPPKLIIPPEYLNEIPPKIELQISFQVTPLGSVEALNVTPSTGYPGLDNLLEKWMQEWTFEPVGGNQVAQGTLPYVIQATTAR